MRARREHEQRWLSIAAFLAFYRSVNVEDASTRRPECDWCDGTGWIDAEPNVINPGTENEQHNTACEPCTCDEGRQRSQSAIWKQRGAAA